MWIYKLFFSSFYLILGLTYYDTNFSPVFFNYFMKYHLKSKKLIEIDRINYVKLIDKKS